MPPTRHDPGLYAAFGPRLRALRAARGWSQRALGRHSGVSKSVISAYEAGTHRPNERTLHRLVRALAADYDALAEAAGRGATMREAGWVTPLGRALRTLRAGRGLSQRAVGAQVGVDQSQVSAWEHGRAHPSRARIRQLAAALSADDDELATLAGYPTP